MGNQNSNLDEVTSEDGFYDVLHFEYSTEGRLVSDYNEVISEGNAPLSPKHNNVRDKKVYGNVGEIVKVFIQGGAFRIELRDIRIGEGRPKPILDITHERIKEFVWDHSHSAVKVLLTKDLGNSTSSSREEKQNNLEIRLPGDEDEEHGRTEYILLLPNSLEFEQELKVRMQVLQKLSPKNSISFQYIGMFAGPTKPKPFQRKRANLSKLDAGQLPSLRFMKRLTSKHYSGAPAPVSNSHSRRLDLAIQHITQGYIIFPVLRTSHVHVDSNAFLRIDYQKVEFYEHVNLAPTLTIPFLDIERWEVFYEAPVGDKENGIEIRVRRGEKYFFQIRYAWDIKHVMEYFNNTILADQGLDLIPASVHGRRVEEEFHLSGSTHQPEAPRGKKKIFNSQGQFVFDLETRSVDGIHTAQIIDDRNESGGGLQNHAKIVHQLDNHHSNNQHYAVAPGGRRRSLTNIIPSTITGNSTTNNRRRNSFNQVIPAERGAALAYFNRVVVHQGWLQKKGGVSKNWQKRYFVLYKTCMGHILSYYENYHETALYCETSKERNIIDCAKVEFIRPVSNSPGTPPYSFDIQSIERDWTLCAKSQEDLQEWLKVISYAVDSDVGILVDDYCTYLVKPRTDPSHRLYLDEYSTFLKIHPWGITVEQGDIDAKRTIAFWCYTDLYKWSILSQKGKIGLQISVFSSADFKKKHEYIFRTREAAKIASVIEYNIEKYMCVMQLQLELPENSKYLKNSEPEKVEEFPVEEQEDTPPVYNNDNNSKVLCKKYTAEDWASDDEDEDGAIDLIGLNDENFLEHETENDIKDFESQRVSAPENHQQGFPDFPENDPFTNDPFSFNQEPSNINQETKMLNQKFITMNDELLRYIKEKSVHLSRTNQGVLLENKTIQISYFASFTKEKGTLQLTYTNISTVPQDIYKLSSTVTTFSTSLFTQASPINPSLGVGESVSQDIKVICMEPFQDPLVLKLSFAQNMPALNEQHNHIYEINLPLSTLHFLEPVHFDKATYMRQWQSIQIPEVQDSFMVSLESHKIDMMSLTKLLSEKFSLHPVKELTYANEEKLLYAAACSLSTGTKNSQGAAVRLGALIRIEGNMKANAYRLTVRTVHPNCSDSIFLALKQQLIAL